MLRQPTGWREFERLRRDMNRLFEGTLPRWQWQRSSGYPAINIWNSKEEGVTVTAELPGVDHETVNISVTGDSLTLEGTRRAEEAPDSAQYHRHERPHGDFKRTVQLPFAVNKEGVEATMTNGVLKIVLPRAEAEIPKQITVQAS